MSEFENSEQAQKRKPILIVIGYLVILLLIASMFGFIALYSYFNLLSQDMKTRIHDSFAHHMEILPDGWIKYTCMDLEMSFEYPKDWKLINYGEMVDLKKDTKSGVSNTSINESFRIGRLTRGEGQAIEQVLAENNRDAKIHLNDNGEDNLPADEIVYESEHELDELSIHKISHYWLRNNWVYYMDGTYYTKDHDHENDPILKRILKSIQFEQMKKGMF